LRDSQYLRPSAFICGFYIFRCIGQRPYLKQLHDAMSDSIDLDAYFARIGFAGERRPTLETLRALQLRHAQSIAFENLDPLLGRPVRLDIGSLQHKLVRDGRGGYCFEQNLLLAHVLRALGFRITTLAGRVLWYAPDGPLTPRTHLLLRIDLDGAALIVDAGFGAQTPTAPLRLEADDAQATPHEPYRLLRADDEFLLQARIGADWRTLYRFGLQEQLLPDIEIVNWYLSNHPESRFVTGLMAARPALGCRYTLRGNEFTVRGLEGEDERRVLTSAAEMRGALEGPLGLTLPQAPEIDALLERIAATRR
jgi:N-hydroxyarylamine O-acetyltransferase